MLAIHSLAIEYIKLKKLKNLAYTLCKKGHGVQTHQSIIMDDESFREKVKKAPRSCWIDGDLRRLSSSEPTQHESLTIQQKACSLKILHCVVM